MDHDYQQHWQRYRKFRNLFWLLFIGFYPAAFTILIAMGTRLEPLYLVLAVVWIVCMLVVGFRVSSWPCPRCGKAFAGAWWYNRGFLVRKCVSCKLPKFARTDPGTMDIPTPPISRI
jgi:hypothetical protein